MKLNKPLAWRKGIVLSATFLFSLLVGVSCKKKENLIGQNQIDQNEILASGGIDTFTLNTFSYFDDSVISTINSGFAVLGSYVDPVFGKFEGEFYTQLRLDGFNPDFGDLNTISIDSFVLSLEYIGQYGKDVSQSIEVFEITEDMHIDTNYYAFSTLTNNSTDNLVTAGTEVMLFDKDALTVVGDDTLSSSQLRISLDTLKARAMMVDAMSGNGYYDDNDAFLDYFKGLRVRVNNPSQMSGDGNVCYFNITDPESKLTLYYTQNGEQETFTFLINSSCAKFNHVEVNTDGTSVAPWNSAASDTINGDVSFYSQAFASRAVVKIPGLSNIPANAVIHKAILDLPVSFQTGHDFTPGLDATVTTLLEGKGSTLFSINAIAEYSDFRKSFEVDIRSYVQAIVNDEIANTQLIFSPILHNTSAERIIFNGPNTSNKNKPKLYIIYTEF